MSSQPPGTFLPNTKVTVGSHKVIIEKYLSEGGFAHVYVVRVPREGGKHEIAVLKRVAVPDKEHLANMRTEVETMKKLKGHTRVVTYYDSHASQLKGGGYEVFLLMEYCSGGGLIDFMNTRLQHRLTEPEILKIFGDVAEGVACMHYLKPPLLHRDLKVENVLISKSAGSGTPTYKLCDFGSTAAPRPAAKTAEEGRLIEEDVQKHTTMQYRSPEMIDVWRKQPIDEKADIWALGVLLYKLCYYTTPFEDVGQMAILNASYKFPTYPSFSERLKKLIASMLKEDPAKRPNIYQVIKESCSMRGTDVPIKDIYANRTQSEARRNQTLPPPDAVSSAPVGLQKVAPQVQVQAIPDVAPMRRGRPTSVQPVSSAKPASSPANGDPFAALDSKNYNVRAGAVDELSKRFPSLDEFSIAVDGGKKFAFSASSPPPAGNDVKNNLSERVTHALADEVFSPPATSKVQPIRQAQTSQSSPQKIPQKFPKPVAPIEQSIPVRTGTNKYRSTAVGSSPPRVSQKPPEISNRPIWRVSDHVRSPSQPRASESAHAAASLLQPSLPPTQRPALLDIHRSKSQTAVVAEQASISSRPSLEGHRPSQEIDESASFSRTKSLNSRSRPSSMYVNSNMDYLRDQEQLRRRPSLEPRKSSRQPSQSPPEESSIADNMDYLRNTEESDRKSSAKGHHKKRSSLNTIGRNMLGGRFSDAFKRFEGSPKNESALITPEPRANEDEPEMLSPIIGSEATPSRHSDMEDETEELPLEVQRELERQRLGQEEKRVAEAAAQYRARVEAQGAGASLPPSRASTIQKRVQSLLDEGRQSPTKKTAEGYGRYTNSPAPSEGPESRPASRPNVAMQSGGPPLIARKPMLDLNSSNNPYPKTRQQQQPAVPMPMPSPTLLQHSVSAPPEQNNLQRIVSRPSAPPKPKALRTGGPVQWPPPQSPTTTTTTIESPAAVKPSSGLAALLAKDLEGVPDYPPVSSGSGSGNHDRRQNQIPQQQLQSQRGMNAGPTAGVDELESFSQRYPSLSGIEMVETEIEGGGGEGRGRSMEEI